MIFICLTRQQNSTKKTTTASTTSTMLYAAVLHTHFDLGVMFRALNPLNFKLSLTNLGFFVLSLNLILPRIITHLFIYPLFRLLFGTLYPAYASYKAVRTKNIKEYVSMEVIYSTHAHIGVSGFVERNQVIIRIDVITVYMDFLVV